MKKKSKPCTTCETVLPLQRFYSDPSKKDGKSSVCSSCRKEKRDRPENKAKNQEYQREYRNLW